MQQEAQAAATNNLELLDANVLPPKRQRMRHSPRPTTRPRTGTTTVTPAKAPKTKKAVRTLPRSGRAIAPKPPAHRAASLIPSSKGRHGSPLHTKTESIAVGPASATASPSDALPSTQTFVLTLPDLTLPAPSMPVHAPLPIPLLEPFAVHQAHRHSINFFGLYFDLFLAPSIEAQSLCAPSRSCYFAFTR